MNIIILNLAIHHQKAEAGEANGCVIEKASRLLAHTSAVGGRTIAHTSAVGDRTIAHTSVY